MRRKLRLIPILILAAVGLLGIKVSDLWLAVGAQAALPDLSPRAGSSEPAPQTAASEPAPTKSAPPAPQAKSEPVPDPLLMSPSEIDTLQKLAERRQALDRRAQELAEQEVLLKAANQRLDEKLASLKTLEKDLVATAVKQDAADDERLKSLVKIYETMKPREAARILEQLDMAIVLDVVEHMKEAKAAPVLAAMDPVKAKAVTAGLAERRQKHPPTTSQQVSAKPQ
ncbi:MAG TPA: hypothetical protein VMG55_13175 [Stellaceae bacterium]|nr:hypothetical protein [Stellaceae bacterium]